MDTETIMLVSSFQRMIFASHNAAAQAAADLIISTVRAKPDAVLGLATGGTMEPVYARIVAAFKKGAVSFAQVTSFNLDEYVDLPPDHPNSYRSTMDELLFNHIDIDKARTFIPAARSDDSAARADDYERLIAETGGIDLQLLGIGGNGHIGFNEPGSSRDSRTRLVELHQKTIEANARFFDDRPMPSHAITMGIGTILSARNIAVVATGTTKADAVHAATLGGFDAACPASALQEHKHVSWFLDAAAAGQKAAA